MRAFHHSCQELTEIRAEIGRLKRKEKSLFASFLNNSAALARQSADDMIERQLRLVFRHDRPVRESIR